MRISTLISYPSARTALKNIGRVASGLLLLLAFTLPLPAVDLLYVTTDGGNVLTFDVSSGNAATIASTKSTFVSFSNNILGGLAFDSNNNLFVGDNTNGIIYNVTPGGSSSQFATGFNYPNFMAFDSSNNLFVSNWGTNEINKVTPGGSVSTFASGMSAPYGLAFDTSGNLYASNGNNATISMFTPGGTKTTFASLTQPIGLAFDSSGNLFAAQNNGAISKITPGGSVSAFATGVSYQQGIVIDSSDNLYIANYIDKSISKFDSSGTLLFTFSTGTTVAASPHALALVQTAVPEPSTYALAAIATGVIGVLARRRKARKTA